MKKETRLYNVLFPVWMLFLFPITWLVVLPGNFIIDSMVLLVSITLLGIDEKKSFYKKNILKIFSFGILADAIGSAYMLGIMFRGQAASADDLSLTIPALLISSVLIFVFNYFVTFKNCGKKARLLLPLIFAVITAPYTFLIPTSWMY